MSDTIWPELPPIDDPVELLGLLRAGDTLHHCLSTGWRLVRGDIAVTAGAVGVLRRGCLWFVKTEDGNEEFDFRGGCLAPMRDGLFPELNRSQTYRWADGGSHAKH